MQIGAQARALLCVLVLAFAASASPAANAPPAKWPTLTLSARAGTRQFVTHHSGTFNAQRVRYRAEVAETIVTSPSGTPAASLFTFAYLADRADPAARPVIFIFNGGPGGASDALHFGALGPKRLAKFTSVALADPATPLIENPDTVLDAADLVFIDPPDTGYSRMLPGVSPELFHSVDGDSYAIGQMILRWLHDHGRMGSPKYLAGESYGTLRAVALARDLAAATPKVMLDGLVLISQAITYNGPQSARGGVGDGRLIYAINQLPGIAALAWYYGRIDNRQQTLEEAIEKARVFARTEYARALLLGNRLDPSDREHIAQRLAELTGLPASYYLSHRLRIESIRLDLLRDEGKVLGQFDGRETEPAASFIPDEKRDWTAAMRGLTENMNAYAAHELGVRGLEPYRSLVADPYAYDDHWTYIESPEPTLDVVLSQQMRTNPNLQLLVTQGIFDTTSVMGATEFRMSQLDIPSARLTLAYFNGGHMLYSDVDGLKALTSRVRQFVTHQALGRNDFPAVQPAHRFTAMATTNP